MNIPELQKRLADFAAERDWDQYHSPKNLSMGLAAEAAELLEIFQWLTEAQSSMIMDDEKEMVHVKEEMADIFIYLARLATKLNVDIEAAVLEKIKLNEAKYPVALSKGNATKYNKRHS